MSLPDETMPVSHEQRDGATGSFHASGSALELASILERYMDELQDGKAPSREELLRDHPELADRLESCLAGIDFIHRAAHPEVRTGPAAAGEPLLLGDFRIVREVGRGGMGVVYEAEQLSLKRRVALKVLRFGVVDDHDALSRFQREAETVAKLHHTNIVPIFAVGSENSVSYYAMQFIEGRSLADVFEEAIKHEKLPTYQLVAQWGLQAAEALAHAHGRGVVHRDVKPSNLLLDGDGTLWLTDFGLAKRSDEATLTLSGALMGTPRYMSPEQAEAFKKPVDHRTDVYSLGASLYELSTGKPLFESDSPHHVIQRILSDEPKPPGLVRRGFPRDLETILTTCLAKDSSKRYATTRELADDMRAFLEGRSIKARRATLAERIVRYSRKQKKPIAIALVAAITSIGLVVCGWLGVSWYRTSRIGEIVLSTDGAPLSGAWVGEDDEPISAEFAIGTKTTLEVEEGEHRLKVWAKGLPSQIMSAASLRGASQSFKIGLGESLLWKDAQPTRTQWFFTPKLTINSDVVTWDGRELVCFQGWSGRPLWKVSATGKPGVETAIGQLFGSFHGSPQLIEDMKIDLNGDGVGDLAFYSQNRPQIAAISGKDGSLLWWTYADKNDGGLADPIRAAKEALLQTPKGSITGRPIVFDVDGDSAPDLIVALSHSLTEDGKTGVADHLFAISGKTGKALWKRPFYGECDLISWKDKSVVALVTSENQWVGLDPHSGEPIVDPVKLEITSLPRSVRYADLDGDGLVELLALNPTATAERWNCEAYSLLAKKRMWSFEVDEKAEGSEYFPVEAWPIAGDLDGDGSAEVVVPYNDPTSAKIPTRGVLALDGKTGRILWRHELDRLQIGTRQTRTMALAPDLDGDGARDVVVASHATEIVTSSSMVTTQYSVLFIDALSGRDGRSIWWTSQSGASWMTSIQSLEWASTSPPMLLATVGQSAVRKAWNIFDLGESALLIDGSSGRRVSTIESLEQARLVDLIGDAEPELMGIGEKSLVAFNGPQGSSWRSIGEWIPSTDLDGDGTTDVIGPAQRMTSYDRFPANALTARAGADGRILWHSSAPLSKEVSNDPGTTARLQMAIEALPSPQGDVDGDGVSDFMAAPAGFASSSGPGLHLPVSAISGATGKRIWSAADLPQSKDEFGNTLRTGWLALDLNSDRAAEVNVVHVFSMFYPGVNTSKSTTRLTSLDGRSGRILWDTILARRAYTTGLSTADVYPVFAAKGLDGDGLDDLLVAYESMRTNGEQGWELSAVGGKDGKILWSYLFSGKAPPEIATGDMDVDGVEEIAVAEWMDDIKANIPLLHVSLLDGKTGKPRWERTPGLPSSRGPSLAPVRFVKTMTNGKPRVYLTVIALPINKPSDELMLFDEDGAQVRSVPLASQNGAYWTIGDLDADGLDEILYMWGNSTLKASNGDLTKELWSVLRVSGWMDPSIVGSPAKAILHNSDCIDGKTGKLLWSFPSARHAVDPSTKPWLLTGFDGSNAAVPIDFKTTKRKELRIPADPRRLRALPWVSGANFVRNLWQMAGMAALAFGVLVVPYALVRFGWRRGRFGLSFYLTMIAALAVILGSVPIFNISMGATFRHASFLLAVLVMFVFAGIGLPLLVYVYRFLKSLMRWRAFLGLLAVTMIVGLAIGLILVEVDKSSKAAFESYSLARWYELGVYATGPVGLGMMIWAAMRWLIEKVAQRRRRMRPIT